MSRGILDGGDDPHPRAAALALFNVDCEHPLQALRPAHPHRWDRAAPLALGASLPALACFIPVIPGFIPGARHDLCAPAMVGSEDTVKACEVHPGSGCQGGQAGEKIQRLEHDMRGAIPVRGLQRIADVALPTEREPLAGNGRARDIPAKRLERRLDPTPRRPLLRAGRSRSPQAMLLPVLLRATRGERLQREYLLTLRRTESDPVGDRVALQVRQPASSPASGFSSRWLLSASRTRIPRRCSCRPTRSLIRSTSACRRHSARSRLVATEQPHLGFCIRVDTHNHRFVSGKAQRKSFRIAD